MVVIVFGSSGSIGSFIVSKLRSMNKEVFEAPRNFDITKIPLVDAAIWCQGANINDSIGELDDKKYLEIMDVNLHFVTRTLNLLVKHAKLKQGSRCLVVSSLWQEFTRDNKFSYTVSKAALGGLVRSCSVDLGAQNIFINALLPGPIDNEMTRHNLTAEQINKLPGFVQLDDIWQLTNYLCFLNRSTNGQSIIIDLGFSVRKM